MRSEKVIISMYEFSMVDTGILHSSIYIHTGEKVGTWVVFDDQ